ncbi:MAG: hypothetical protein M5R42_07675 [Rhodocyclaceae bacterium]|nr:hypothetical protein [Rhodocyclaceae bacterium]
MRKAAGCAKNSIAATPPAPPNSTTWAASRSGTTCRPSAASSNCARGRSEHLGYGNFAEVSLVPKMAESPADVLAFLR